MARFLLCKYCGDLHQLGRWPDNCKSEPWPRSDYPSPYVVSDYLPGGVNGLFHHAALRKIDNKAEYRRVTREHGCIEIGNEHLRSPGERDDRTLGKDVIESAVNDALHEHGISSDSDMSRINFDGP